MQLDELNLPIAIGAGLLLLIVIIVTALWRRKTAVSRRIRKTISAISSDVVSDFLFPDGMGGQIHIDHLLLTTQGFLVLDIKDVHGLIFAGEKMDNWTVMAGPKRYTFSNPLNPMLDRVAAVKSMVWDVPVSGRVVFTVNGEFAKGQPGGVVMLEGLREEYGGASGTMHDKVVEAFRPQWDKIKQAAAPPV